jgi:hypothetical protein
MWPFRKKGDVETKIDKLDYAIENSFQRVRSDMDQVNQWISYLYAQDMERQRLIDIIHGQMQHLSTVQVHPPAAHAAAAMPHIDGRMRHVEEKIDALSFSIKAIEPIVDKVAKLNSQVKLVEENQNSVFERLKEFSSRIEKAEAGRARTSSNLREKIVKKVARHSKEYIRNLILSTIGRYEQISALQLREMIVEEQGLCSKSTFYRILEEIEAERSVEMIARGKEKVYLPKALKKHHA